MKKILFKKVNEFLPLFSIITLFLFLMTFYLYLTNKPFYFGNDQLFQYDIFYREWFNLIDNFFKGQGLPMYSWKLYLGSDFYSSMTYYCVGDIFILILYPLSLFINTIKHLLTLETYICFYLSAFFFYVFLKKKGIKKVFNIYSASIIFAIGGWSVSYLGDYMFHRFYTFLPLLLLGIEYYYQNHKCWLISLSVFILSMQNFYMMYPTILFIFIYCVCIEFGFSKEERKKRFFKDFITVFLSFIIGFMLASVVLVPALLTTLNNSRVGGGFTNILWDVKTYIQLLLSPISSQFPVYSSYPNIFFQYDGGHSYWFVIYIGIVYFISAVSYCTHKHNYNHLFMLIVILLITCLKPLSSMMHGFSEPSFRWLFLVETYFLIIGSLELDQDERINNKIFLIYFILAFLSIIILVLIGYNVIEYKIHYLFLLIYLFSAVVIWVIYRKDIEIALILSVCEILILSLFNIVIKSDMGQVFNRIDKDEVAYYESIDDDLLYRYYIDWENVTPYGTLNLNVPMDYGLMTSKTYNSMYDNATNKFNSLNENYRHFIDIKNPYSLNMLGTKYWIVYSEDELPLEFEFEYCHNLSDLKVYKNLNYKGFGFISSKLDYLDNFNDFIDFEDTLFIDDPDYVIDDGIREYKQLNIIEKGSNYLKGEIDLNYDNVLLIPIPNNSGWKIIVNQNVVKPISVNGGFIGIELKSGYNSIEMYFVSPGLKVGAIISCLGIINFILVILKDKKIIVFGKRK